VHEAACREALEEAGVRGAINVTTLFCLSHSLALASTSLASSVSGVLRSNLLASRSILRE